MKLIASFFFVGYLRPGPGTWGSLAALPAAWLLHAIGGVWLLIIAGVVLFAAGYVATKKLTEGATDHDPSWIVVDEVVGQWIALLTVSYGATAMGIDVLRLWPGILSAFVFFRLFDIWKPWLVGRADRSGGAMGVMLDDVIAGVFATIVTAVLAAIAHGFLM
ncbi:phosphatidylglycerophosphatase A family protein [Allosediminivita pacifica]|uniref:Phosphatidylglycerophosphatase A n=1 Tax=Allosediminivita pacifica TaxID=1267769 RepID=A0A2T6B2Q2_9RHOB|nr:phosphatidylglycerophosphatase A [Allosediminivita pacifica]PTX50302.1 phosphatidylglycerophosphatase A [Allosediminivita pacifica]GGB03029.1 phosphatidylglycerophosphatase A [Allosediminivita pacifica]